MKRVMKVTTILASLTLVLIMFVFSSIWLDGQVSAQTEEAVAPGAATVSERTVSVNGQGRVSVQPDTAVVWFGVQTRANTAVEALEENNLLMQEVISVTIASGVDEEDIQTQGINLNAVYNQPQNANQQPQLTGYQASNIVEVTVHDLDSLGDLLDTVVEAGATNIQGINFQVSNNAALLQQARQEAVNNAQETAEQLVSLTGADLGPVLRISESSFTPLPAVAFNEIGVRDSGVPVAPGTLYVEVSVQITWEIE